MWKFLKFIYSTLLKNKKGQAVFEFIIFLPFMLLIYTLVVTICNAVNGSINQQKATRGYLFARIKNNSNVPLVGTLNGYDGVKNAGMVMIGWRKESQDGDRPVAPCYQLKSYFASSAGDDCLTGNEGRTTSQFIRVKTAFGICGNTYVINGPNDFSRSFLQSMTLSCMLLSDAPGTAPPSP